LHSRLRRVRDNDDSRTAFQHDYRFGTTRIFPQADFESHQEQPLWIAEFQTEIWDDLRNLPLLSSIADVNQGLQHKGRGLPKGAKTVEDEPFPGSVEGYASSSGDWGIHEHPALKHFNLPDDVIRRRGTGADCVPQVILNYSPVSRGTWRLKAFLDPVGRAFLSTFLSVRPHRDDMPLEYLWAILNCPLANSFIHSRSLKRHNLPRTVGKLPFPIPTDIDVMRVVFKVQKYIARAKHGHRDMYNQNGYTSGELVSLLLAIDVEVLRLYGLPAKAERLLLEQFRGEQRPGIPVQFTEYYPANTPDVPLYAYRSSLYQRALAGGSPELSAQDLARYEALCEKDDNGTLTSREAGRLHELQAEVDGRDYWMRYSGKRSEPIAESRVSDGFDLRLRELSDRAATASIKRSKQ
jgi:hypothetical protein